MAVLVPGGIFLDGKPFLILGSLKIFNMDPWIKVFHKMTKMTPKLSHFAILVLGVSNFGNL